jgi:hypothetical protein
LHTRLQRGSAVGLNARAAVVKHGGQGPAAAAAAAAAAAVAANR